MKILTISTVEFTQNGITSVIMNYYKTLVKLFNVQMDFIGQSHLENCISNELQKHKSNYTYIKNRKKNPFRYSFYLYKIIKKNKYDIVHVHGSSRIMAIELFVSKIAGVPVRIAHSHSTNCDHKILHYLLTPLFFHSLTNGIACSYDAGNWLFNKKQYTILKNGIDVKKYMFNKTARNEIREELGLNESDFIIGNVAGFYPVKNHYFIVDLIASLIKINSNIKCILIGDGELYSKIQNEIKDRGLSHNIILLGNKTNVNKYYNAMDLFLLPSLYEGFPMVLVEEQCNGLSAFVSKNISLDTNITGNVFYLPIDKGTEVWQEKILEYMKQVQNREITSKNAQQKILKCGFDISYNSRILYELYQSFFNK